MDSSTGFSPVIECDWLDVTFPAYCDLASEASGFLLDCGAVARRVRDEVLEYRLPGAEWGNFQLQESKRGWTRLSASGDSCNALRASQRFAEYLSIIGGHPHALTRLDTRLDLHVPASPVISGLVSRYPIGSEIKLTRKAVPVRHNLQSLPDGSLTGTFYAGDLRGSARALARVYDKQAERASRGVEVGPCTRYELVTRKGLGVTLRDVSDPAPLFWKFMSPVLLNAPADVPAWAPYDGDGWTPGAIAVDPYQRLVRRVERSVDLEHLQGLADGLGDNGRRHLLRLIRNRLGLRDIAIA